MNISLPLALYLADISVNLEFLFVCFGMIGFPISILLFVVNFVAEWGIKNKYFIISITIFLLMLLVACFLPNADTFRKIASYQTNSNNN
jgi:hypothetical protein